MNQINKVFLLVALTTALFACSPLKKNEIAKIRFELYGCFGSEQSTLTVFRTDGLNKARLETGDNYVHIVNISEEGMKSLNHFVSTLKSARSTEGCTTDQSCVVYTRDEKIEKAHIDCSWKGFSKLKKDIFFSFY